MQWCRQWILRRHYLVVSWHGKDGGAAPWCVGGLKRRWSESSKNVADTIGLFRKGCELQEKLGCRCFSRLPQPPNTVFWRLLAVLRCFLVHLKTLFWVCWWKVHLLFTSSISLLNRKEQRGFAVLEIFEHKRVLDCKMMKTYDCCASLGIIPSIVFYPRICLRPQTMKIISDPIVKPQVSIKNPYALLLGRTSRSLKNHLTFTVSSYSSQLLVIRFRPTRCSAGTLKANVGSCLWGLPNSGVSLEDARRVWNQTCLKLVQRLFR